MKEYSLFIKRFFSNPRSIGAFCPSSKKLALKMTEIARSLPLTPLRYLEIGAGLGALTAPLIKKMKEEDTLDIVEVDEVFCAMLNKKYGNLPNVSIYETSILDFDKKEYDIVISSLPLNVFNPQMVEKVLLKYKTLVKKGGYISFFEYIGTTQIRKFYLPKRFKNTLYFKNNFINSYCIETYQIWWHCPPARVFHCQM